MACRDFPRRDGNHTKGNGGFASEPPTCETGKTPAVNRSIPSSPRWKAHWAGSAAQFEGCFAPLPPCENQRRPEATAGPGRRDWLHSAQCPARSGARTPVRDRGA